MGERVKALSFSFLPRYSRDAASSRLRVYALAEALELLGHRAFVGFDSAADVLVVQKAIDESAFRLAEKFQGRVVYDFDDVLDQRTLERAREVADVWISDTPGHAALAPCPCAVLPDPIDYAPPIPLPPSAGSGAVWFGNYPCFDDARWMAHALTLEGVPVRLISEPAAALAGYQVTRWSLYTFVAELRRSAVAFLAHGATDRHKSANKMLAAIALGLPSIVSDTPAYAELARDLGLEWSIVRERQELLEAWRRLSDPEQRSLYLAKAQPFIWTRYRPAAIARQFLSLLG